MGEKVRGSRGLLRRIVRWSRRAAGSGAGLQNARFWRHNEGNVGPLMAVMLVPIIGALSMGVEASSWFLMSRAAQNAADSAAVGAANNGVSTEYQAEGRANASQYGFSNGSNNVVVNVTSGVTCPDGTATCYKAVVTKKVPIYLTRIVGFNGDTAIGTTQPAKTITSTALAEPISAISFPSCITAVGSDTSAPGNNGTAISGSGTPNASGPGCSMSAAGPSPSSIGCTGSNGLGANYGFATGTISGSGGNTCVTHSTTNANFVFCDPYTASPASGCPSSTYATAVANAVSSAPTCTAAPSTFKNLTLPASVCYNTNVTLDANITGTTMVLTNGANIDFNSKSATNVTVIFTKGTATAPGSVTGQQSSVSISAPQTGNLSGIALYQVAPTSCTSAACDNWTVNGSRTIDVTGLIYLPHTNASFGGSVTTTSAGRCFIGIFNSFATNGTGYVLDRTGCKNDGLGTLPTVLRYRAALVA